jgi:hypothetical protein
MRFFWLFILIPISAAGDEFHLSAVQAYAYCVELSEREQKSPGGAIPIEKCECVRQIAQSRRYDSLTGIMLSAMKTGAVGWLQARGWTDLCDLQAAGRVAARAEAEVPAGRLTYSQMFKQRLGRLLCEQEAAQAVPLMELPKKSIEATRLRTRPARVPAANDIDR